MSKNSPKDLKVRTLSAIVMIAVAGSALWAGGWVFTAFVAIVAAGLLWEWRGLISKFNHGALGRALWMLGGVVYIGGAAYNAISIRSKDINLALTFVCAIMIIDVGAFLVGRVVGGPKIAPNISPAKTWSGAFGAAILLFAIPVLVYHLDVANGYPFFAMLTASMTLIAQGGDFFESWMKRMAGVKDSGQLIPGHGGLFDRLDGVLALSYLFGLLARAEAWL